MKKRFALCVLPLCFGALAPWGVAAQDLGQEFQQNFGKFLPSEKLYLHTDKPNYALNDTIWFKGYLVDAAQHNPARSNFIYVDLLDQYDTVVLSKKIKRDSIHGFRGYLKLGKELAEGDYTIRGYSMWMRNFPKEYYFYKTIQLDQVFEQSRRIRVEAQVRDTAVLLRLHLGADDYKGLGCRVVNLTTGKSYRSANPQRNSQGVVPLTARGLRAGDVVSVEVTGMLNGRSIKRSLRAEVPQAAYAVQFLPEGGDLVGGGVRRVAFRAVSGSGNPIEVSGCVLDQYQDTVALFRSVRHGMGRVTFDADPAKRYTAHTYSADSVFQVTELPTVLASGVALWVQAEGDQVSYWVEKVGAMATKKMYAIVHQWNKLEYVVPLNKRVSRHLVPLGELAAGVSHLVVVDEDRVPLAERLFFVPPRPTSCSIAAHKPSYGLRESVELEVKLPEGAAGDLSVSVTDDGFVPHKEGADHIVSNLLLTSDLHGVIEQPSSYLFSPDVDLLMLTHGWRRFKVSDVLSGVAQPMPYGLEQAQVVTGKVVSGYKKNLREAQVVAQILTTDSVRASLLDDQDRFEIGDLDIAGTKKLMLKAIHPMNRPLDARFEVDSAFAAAAPWAKRSTGAGQFERFVPGTARAVSQVGMGLDQDIYKSLQVAEVVVKARRTKFENVYDEEQANSTPNRLSSKMSYYASPFNKYLRYINPNQSLRELLVHSGYVNSTFDHLPDIERISYYKGLLFVVDGEKAQIEYSTELERWPYRGDQIAAIEVIDGARAIGYGHMGATGTGKYTPKVIIIETTFNNPHIYWNSINKDIAVVDFVGYDRCEPEFYAPRYTRPKAEQDNADYRSTVYWNPNIPAGGKLHFHTTDRAEGTYTVTVEGMASDGRPIHQTHTLTIQETNR